MKPLTDTQQALLRKAIMQALDPNGAPIRLAEIAENTPGYYGSTAAIEPWDFYQLVSNELQRMKREGLVELQKGRGGGWRRVTRGATP